VRLDETGGEVTSSLGWLQKRVFGIPFEETSFTRRGFRCGDVEIRRRLEEIGRVFLHGYHAALEEDQPDRLASALDSIEPELRGFAFEGVGMGLYLLDLLTPCKRNRLQKFIVGPGAGHAYMVHVGAGWALAQLGQKVDRALARFDPLLGWLAVDGYGFHQGYFHWPDTVERQRVPPRLSGYALRVFDQGLGRSLWFVEGADVARISGTVAGFPIARRSDLWSGVGLACAYAGGVDRDAIETLMISARANRGQLAQGAAFAAKARARAGIPSTHTDLACRILCGMSAEDAAHATDVALVDLPAGGVLPAYEVWRQRIQDVCTKVCVDL
jgi:enediyne biosynthesis protein E3